MNQFEIAILDFIQNNLRTEIGNTLMKSITHLGDGGWLCIVFTLILILIPKTRKVGTILTVSLVIEAVICNLILKPLVGRMRPYDFNPDAILLIKRQLDYSFPSGHTGATFAVAAGLFFGKNKMWIPFTILGALIGFSRLYVYVHYPTDVLAGALLGILSGFLASKLVNGYHKMNHSNQRSR